MLSVTFSVTHGSKYRLYRCKDNGESYKIHRTNDEEMAILGMLADDEFVKLISDEDGLSFRLSFEDLDTGEEHYLDHTLQKGSVVLLKPTNDDNVVYNDYRN